ncbi:hypothetical protein [Undibacterium fentianense]|uniref:Uncharacterized protein n=1 Tax=Undibacterium fentianense TaxID=2828728 RepID=A0A941E7X3_9BURK|nr:hypothetical protein [Undibacterium fentianense]MBR7801388.1 hypothetical protein [Undibacterium fentianense]
MQLNSDNLRTIASSSDASEGDRRVAAAVCVAMDDWPTQGQILVDEFLRELLAEFGQPTYENIRSGAARLNITTDAWKAEALTGLLVAWSENNRHLSLCDLLGGLSSPSPNHSFNPDALKRAG